MIKFWAPAKQDAKHEDEISRVILEVRRSGNFICGYGPWVEEFEKKFAEFIGVKECVLMGSGTASLELALRVLGVGSGDEIITVSHTFIATIWAIHSVGATPILVDINKDGLIDPAEVEKAITPRTKAIIPVHLEGKVCNINDLDLIKLAGQLLENNKRIYLIEDTCQAIGAIKNPMSDIQCWSFYPAKVLGSIGNCGAITINDSELAKKLRLMRSFSNIGKNPDIENAEWGGNFEPDNIQAAVLLVKMKYLEQNLARRKEVAERYLEVFKDLPIKLPLNQKGRVWQDFTIRIPERKDEFVKYFNDNGIEVIGHNLIPNHFYPRLGLIHYKLPKTEQYLKEQVKIPCNDILENKEVEYIIEKVKEFYKG